MKQSAVAGATIVLLALVLVDGGCWGRRFFRMPRETERTAAMVDSLIRENAGLRERIAAIEQAMAASRDYDRGANAQRAADLAELKDQLNALEELIREAQYAPSARTDRPRQARPDTTQTKRPAAGPTPGGERGGGGPASPIASGKNAADTTDIARGPLQADTLAGGAAAGPPDSAAAAPAAPLPEALHRRVYLDYSAGQYELAIEESDAFLREYADDPLAEDVLYLRGESFMQLGKHFEALESFKDLLQGYPRGKRASASLLRMAIAYEAIGEREMASAVARRLIAEYPRSSEAEAARERFGDALKD